MQKMQFSVGHAGICHQKFLSWSTSAHAVTHPYAADYYYDYLTLVRKLVLGGFKDYFSKYED